MEIRLEKAGKRYRLDWIFRDLDYSFRAGERYALLGPNGSGKSTLMKVLSGHLSPSRGSADFFDYHGSVIPPEFVYRHISYAAPYIELIEEFSLKELLKFHSRLKPLLPPFSPKDVLDLLALPKSADKELRYFSSGMKQRVKIILAILSDTPAILLDEPATNLDLAGIAWYKELIRNWTANRLVIIASNDPGDAEFCKIHLNINDFKFKQLVK